MVQHAACDFPRPAGPGQELWSSCPDLQHNGPAKHQAAFVGDMVPFVEESTLYEISDELPNTRSNFREDLKTGPLSTKPDCSALHWVTELGLRVKC